MVEEVLRWLSWLIISFFLFIVPGWALLSIIWPFFKELNWLEKLALGAGVSLALYTMLMLFADRLNLKLGAIFAWLPMIIGCLILFRQNYKKIRQVFSPSFYTSNIFSSIFQGQVFTWSGIGLFAIIILIFFVRFWAIRTIDLPMWGDFVHHTVIAQLILDNKGLFNSWEPYASYRSMTVQYGFSAHAAVFAWITGLPSYTAALIVGQIINGLAILTLIPFSYRLSPGNSWAATGTLIYAGLISPMPAFYVNWGRYAQLDAQTILPVAIWLTCEFLEIGKWRRSDNHLTSEPSNTGPFGRFRKELIQYSLKYYWIPVLLIASLIVAMVLSSYRLAHFYAGFLLAWIFYFVISRKYKNVREWIDILFRILAIFVFCLILFLPWLERLVGSSLTGMVKDSMSVSNLQANFQEFVVSWSQDKFLYTLRDYLHHRHCLHLEFSS